MTMAEEILRSEIGKNKRKGDVSTERLPTSIYH